MNAGLVICGAIFVLSPAYHWWSVRWIRRRIDAKGGDGEAFERRMTSRGIWVAQGVVLIVGVVLVAYGVNYES